MGRLDGKVAVITGASSGIGLRTGGRNWSQQQQRYGALCKAFDQHTG